MLLATRGGFLDGPAGLLRKLPLAQDPGELKLPGPLQIGRAHV